MPIPDEVPVFGISPDANNQFRAEQAQLALDAMEQFFEQDTINGVSYRIEPMCPNVWASTTEIPKYDAQLRNPTKFLFAEVCMTPVTWIRLQAAQQGLFFGNVVMEPEDFLAKFRPDDPEKTNLGVFVEKLKGELPTDIPIPVLEIGTNARLNGVQEGRTRGVGAYMAGLDRINVLVVVNTERDDKEDTIQVSSTLRFENFLDEQLESFVERTRPVGPESPVTRWQRLMNDSRQAVERLGIDSPLAERDEEAQNDG